MTQLLIGFAVGVLAIIPLGYLYSKRAVKRAKELGRRARDAERLAYVGTLAGGLAHEIKNPLSTLNLNLQLIKEDWQNASSLKEKRLCSKIDILQRETRRLEETLNDFLRFARGQKLELSDRDINAVVDDVISFIAPEAATKNITIHKSYDTTIPTIKIDKDLIKQALLNIVINAQQAMPQGGELMVRTKREDDMCRIDITDTGTGMPPDAMKKVFNAYYSTKNSGSGLGLPTARRIINEHSGNITVQSELEKGSCFSVLLPFSPPAD